MATTKEIKNRIKSVKDTQKITNAMYLISSTKMTKAKKELEGTRPYFDMLKENMVSMIRLSEDMSTDYFKKAARPADEPCGIVIITADKGLCGAYNQNIIKEANKLMQKYPHHRLYVVGEYGRHYFLPKNLGMVEEFDFSNMNPTLDRAREIGDFVIEEFDSGKIKRLYLVYTDFKNGLTGGSAHHTELLPFDKEDFNLDDEEKQEVSEEIEYMPDVVTVFENIVPGYVMGFIYSAMVDSYCSEQAARMTAMDSANQNAEDLLSELNLEYNHVRQGAITQEITEVSAGSRGQKLAKEKLKERHQEAAKQNADRHY